MRFHQFNFRKSILFLAIFFIVTVFLGTSIVFAKTINIKIAHVDTPIKLNFNSTNGEFGSCDIKALGFKNIVEKRSEGRFKVKILPAGQLGGEREMIEMTKMGSLEMNACSAAALANFAPEVMAIQIPYIFRDENVGLKVMNGPVGQEMNEMIAKKTGLRILAWDFEGYYNIGNVKKSIRLPGDLKGLKIRVSESPNTVEILKLTGGVPTPVSFTEVYTTLQQGVVDGVMTGIAFHDIMKTYEIIKYYTVSNAWFGWSPITINEKFYQSLSPKDRYLVKSASIQAMASFQGLLYWGRDLWIEKFQKKGIKFTFLTPAEQEEWIKTLRQPMIEWTKKKIGTEWVDKIMKASKQAEKELYGN